MIKISKSIYSYSFIFFFFIIVNSQYALAEDDRKLWISSKYDIELIDDFSLSAEQEIRLTNKMEEFDQALISLGGEYKITNNIRFFAGYRGRAKNYDYIYFYQNEAITHLSFKNEIIDDLTFDIRLRANIRYDKDDANEVYLRPRIKFNYKLFDFVSPYFEFEALYRTLYEKKVKYDNNGEKLPEPIYVTGDKFDETRTTIGLAFDLPRKITLDLFYTYQNEFNVKNPNDANVVGLSLKFENPLKNKSKEEKIIPWFIWLFRKKFVILKFVFCNWEL